MLLVHACLLLQEFPLDPWRAWESFGVGSSIEFATTGRVAKKKATTHIDKKEENTITLTTTWIEGEKGKPQTFSWTVTKAQPPGGQPCSSCKKPHEEWKSLGSAQIKVDTTELSCQKVERTFFFCKNLNGKITRQKSRTIVYWVSPKVPGHVVKQDEGRGEVIQLLRFEVRE